MLSIAVGPDSPDQDPYQKYLPCKTLIRDGQPVYEVIAAPEPTPMPPEAARKAATSQRLKDETTALQNTIRHNLKVHGNDGSTGTPDRGWNSSNPNDNFLNAYASGTFGRAIYREKAVWDREAYQDAKLALKAWEPRPWSGHCEVKFPQGAIAAPEARVYTGELTTAAADKRVTKESLNKAYEAYRYATPATETATQLGDLEAALYAFAPKEGRLRQCEKLLRNSHGRLAPEDIVQDFAVDLIHRFKKGQYHTHVGTMEKWIDWVWCKWFFPDVKTKFYVDASLTVAVNDSTFDSDEAEATDRTLGEKYRVDVDREQAKRDKMTAAGADAGWILADSIFRDLDDPTTVWGSVHETTKKMLRRMRDGDTQKQAAEAVDISERHGVRLMKELRETVAEVAK